MKVFVTGATGYIGRAVCRQLKADGNEVIGLTHQDSHRKILEDMGVQPVVADIKSTEQWKNYLDQVDAVIHLAQDTKNPAEGDNAVVETVSKAFAGSPRGARKRFVYTSGLWVLGNVGPEQASEITPTNPVPMVVWRADLEKQLIAAERTSDLNVVIIRPAMVYGEGGGAPAMFARSAYEEGAARFVGDGENLWTMVEVNDLANLYVLALKNGESGEIYHAADNQSYTVRELAEAASQGAGRGGEVKSWPLAEAKKELGSLAEALTLSQNISGAKAMNFLNWVPKAPYNAIEDLKLGSYAQQT